VKGDSSPFVPIAILRAELDSTLALTCAFVIAPSENAVDAERKTAAYLMFASVVAKKIANPATTSGPVSAMRVCREFIRQLNVVMMTVQAAPIMYSTRPKVSER
jgi:hypothetical protein